MMLYAVGTGIVFSAAEGDSIGNLLKGGGFAVVVAIIAGGFAWLNSKSGAAKSIAEGAKELVEGNTAEMVRARVEAQEAREELAKFRREMVDERTQMTRDLGVARLETTEARTDLRAAHRSLEDAQTAIRAGQNERQILREWIRDTCQANKDHNAWDHEVQEILEGSGMHIRPAPALTVSPPQDR